MLRTVQTLTIFVIFGSLALLPWGAIEGRWLPVMGNLAISDPRPYPPPDYRTKWNGTAVKLRNCEWLRTEWYLGDRNGGRVRVNFEHLDPPQVRTPGQLS